MQLLCETFALNILTPRASPCLSQGSVPPALQAWDRAVSAELLLVLCHSLVEAPGGVSDATSVIKNSSAASPELHVHRGDAAASRLRLRLLSAGGGVCVCVYSLFQGACLSVLGLEIRKLSFAGVFQWVLKD